MKRILSIMVILVIACLILIGCAQKEKPAEEVIAALPTWTLIKDFPITHYKYTNVEGFIDENRGVTVGCYNQIDYTTDGGKTWITSSGVSNCRFSMDIVDENLIWSGGWRNVVCFSKDGGKTWTDTPTNLEFSNKHSQISFIDDTTGWVASYSELAATGDGGKSWTTIALPEGVKRVAAIHLLSANIGYLLSLDSQFFTTKDAGQTWSKKDLEINRFNIVDQNNKADTLVQSNTAVAEITFSDENNGMIVFVGYVPNEGYKAWILSTTDGGAIWADEQIIMADGFNPTTLHLTRDGKYLTFSDIKKRVNVFKHK